MGIIITLTLAVVGIVTSYMVGYCIGHDDKELEKLKEVIRDKDRRDHRYAEGEARADSERAGKKG